MKNDHLVPSLSLLSIKTTLYAFEGDFNASQKAEPGGLCNGPYWLNDVNCLLVNRRNPAGFLFHQSNWRGNSATTCRVDFVNDRVGLEFNRCPNTFVHVRIRYTQSTQLLAIDCAVVAN